MFFEYNLAAEIDKKFILTQILFWGEKRQEALEKKLACKFIRINTSKEGYDANYEIGRIQAFISKFENRQLRKLEKRINQKNKRTRR